MSAYNVYPNAPRTLYLAHATGPATRTYGDGPDALTVSLPVAARDCVAMTCTQCGRSHDALWTVRRVIADTLGPWAVYRIAGESWTFPGGGLPLTLARLPRDAEPVDSAAHAAFWHAS